MIHIYFHLQRWLLYNIPYSEKHSVFWLHLVGDSYLQTSNPAHVELLVIPQDGVKVPMLLEVPDYAQNIDVSKVERVV